MSQNLRKAGIAEIPEIWDILQQAILRRKNDGSEQWQNGYPNPDVVRKDIETGSGYVLTDNDMIIGYCAVIINDEPAYRDIKGRWLTNGDFIVVHRVAISGQHTGKGLACRIFELIEKIALDNDIHSIKVDTNFDNAAMLKTLERSGYTYCGEVYINGTRKAFEKKLP